MQRFDAQESNGRAPSIETLTSACLGISAHRDIPPEQFTAAFSVDQSDTDGVGCDVLARSSGWKMNMSLGSNN